MLLIRRFNVCTERAHFLGAGPGQADGSDWYIHTGITDAQGDSPRKTNASSEETSEG